VLTVRGTDFVRLTRPETIGDGCEVRVEVEPIAVPSTL
jgi:hypothetical protein